MGRFKEGDILKLKEGLSKQELARAEITEEGLNKFLKNDIIFRRYKQHGGLHQYDCDVGILQTNNYLLCWFTHSDMFELKTPPGHPYTKIFK